MQMLLYYSQDFSTQYVDDFDDLPFDVDTLRLHIERLVMASEPWQAWAMNVRQVYRWEDPQRTGKWLALFVVLWYTSHIVAFFVSCPITATLQSRLTDQVRLYYIYDHLQPIFSRLGRTIATIHGSSQG